MNIIYDNIISQQNQCLIDIALQYYGTADPVALIDLCEDNNLNGITQQLQAGTILKIRRNAQYLNKNLTNYYKTNNIIPASDCARDNTMQNLIIDVINFDYYNLNLSWNSSNNILTVTGNPGSTFTFRVLTQSLQANTSYNLYIECVGDLYGSVSYAGGWQLIHLHSDKHSDNIIITSSWTSEEFSMYFGYVVSNYTYNIKLILTEL